MIVQIEDVRRVDLDDAAEAQLLEYALECGGVVVQSDRATLEQLMADTVQLLSEIDNALTVPAIIRDLVPRA